MLFFFHIIGISFEGSAKLMFDRQKYSVSADLQVPDYDLEAGIRVHAVDRETQSRASHSIQIDFISKNIPEASLVALAKYVHVNIKYFKYYIKYVLTITAYIFDNYTLYK